jgi:hypothetical protein
MKKKLRFALGIDPLLPGAAPAFNNTPLTTAEVSDLAAVTAKMLGDDPTKVTRAVLPIPP